MRRLEDEPRAQAEVEPPRRAFFKGRGVRIAISTVFTIGIGFLIYRYVSVEMLVSAFGRIDLKLAALGLVTYAAVTVVRALRFVIAGARLPFGAMFRIAAVHAALLRVMPLRSGELAYAILLKRHGGGGFTEGIAAILMLRILDLVAVLPLAAAILIAWLSGTDSGSGGLAVVAAGLALGVIFFSLGPITRAIARKIGTLPEQGWLRKAGKLVHTLAEAYDLPLSRRFALLAVTFLLWALVLIWFHFTLLAIGAVSVLEEGFVVGIMGVTGSILPVSLIGTFGPMEGGFAIGLATIGQNHADASAVSIVVSTLTFVANWLVAIPAWIVLVFTKTKLINSTD
ncbi:MAG: flippase-like domain-containing protein [Deltaproteobacteria bacterium]|nr:flippase-like domain-containing protein [Deltaproteobacteria bacterium]